MTNYTTKTDLDNIAHTDTSSFALKTNLNTLKTEVDKLDIPKVVPVPIDLEKLSNKVQSYQTKNETELSDLSTKVQNSISYHIVFSVIIFKKIYEIKIDQSVFYFCEIF